jgi:short subunit dehydrogenase-like uncharacterized protein
MNSVLRAGFLIYGANGYTGGLIAREAIARGHRPVLAGRNQQPVEAAANDMGLEGRVFGLDDAKKVDASIRDVDVVLNCAGPFSRTAEPLVQACLRTITHYVDITGEAAVFEAVAGRGEEAKAAGVMLLPGAGFDVAPSDCLAAHLKRRLPSATKLALAFEFQGRLSRGTALTMLENLHGQGLVRIDGKLTRVPAAWKTRTIDFGGGPVKAVTIPWGDVVTAYYSTGIGNIEVYMVAPLVHRLALRSTRYLAPLLRRELVRRQLEKRIRAARPGPSDAERARGASWLWGEVSDDGGNRAVSRIRGPDGYTLTAQAAIAVIQRVLAGDAPAGYQTPSMAYGPDFVLTLPGVERTEEG